MTVERDRDPGGRARSSRRRDDLGRPLARAAGVDDSLDTAALPPSEALQRAQDLLDAGQPFAAHEVLEAVWKQAAPAEREFWRGLAQLAVGITHALRGNDAGAATLLERSAESLAPYAHDAPYDVDVDGLRVWLVRASKNLTMASQPPRLRQN